MIVLYKTAQSYISLFLIYIVLPLVHNFILISNNYRMDHITFKPFLEAPICLLYIYVLT